MEALTVDVVPKMPQRNQVFPILMPPRPLSIEIDATLEREAAVLSPTGPRSRSPSVTPMSRMPSPTAEELMLREQMDLLMLDVASKCQDSGRSLEDAFPDDAARVTSSELTAFLEEAGVANAAETANKMIDGCKKYVGDKTPVSAAELKVHTLKQALRVAVAKSLRPRSRSSNHSSPSTVPNSRLATPLAAHTANSPALALIEENPQPLKSSPASPGNGRKKAGRSRFGRSPGGACSPERVSAGAVSAAVDENRPLVQGVKELASPPRGLHSKLADQFAAGKEGALFGSPPKQPFLELRDMNAKPLPGFISQVAITASAKQHLAAGVAGAGNGMQRKLSFSPGGEGRGCVCSIRLSWERPEDEEDESEKVYSGAQGSSQYSQRGGGGANRAGVASRKPLLRCSGGGVRQPARVAAQFLHESNGFDEFVAAGLAKGSGYGGS